MADMEQAREAHLVVINEALYFVRCKYGKIGDSLLKQTLLDFFDGEKLATAKNRLNHDIEELRLDDWPCLPPRREGADRAIKEAEDIMVLFRFIDEKLSFQSIPTYVSANMDSVPSTKWLDGDIQMLLAKLNNMEQLNHELHRKFNLLEIHVSSVQKDALAYRELHKTTSGNMFEKMDKLGSAVNSLGKMMGNVNIQNGSNKVSAQSAQNVHGAQHVTCPGPGLTDSSQPQRTWAELSDPGPRQAVSSQQCAGIQPPPGLSIQSLQQPPIIWNGPNGPVYIQPYNAPMQGSLQNALPTRSQGSGVVGPTVRQSFVQQQQQQQYSESSRHFHGSRSAFESTTAAESADDERDGPFSLVVNKKKATKRARQAVSPGNNMEVVKRPKPKPIRVIGKNQASSRIKASGAVIAKAVFCVSNVSMDDSAEDLVECLKDNGITVLSCGKANTKFTETKAFRVCIAKVDSDRFLDSDIWPENVIVRSWVFKGKKSEDSSTNTNDGHAD